jgi:antitoxin component YwqK of YwqJK toxin-antitoxin module
MFYIDPNTEKTKEADGRTKEVLRYKESQTIFGERYYNEKDLLEGKATFYDEEGNLQCISFFKDGELHGTKIEYDKDGNKISNTVYVNGEEIK